MENLSAEAPDIKLRQAITRTIVHKLVATYGMYPTKETRQKVAGVLGDILGLHHHLFYDPVTHEGFLERGIQNARRRLPGTDLYIYFSCNIMTASVFVTSFNGRRQRLLQPSAAPGMDPSGQQKSKCFELPVSCIRFWR